LCSQKSIEKAKKILVEKFYLSEKEAVRRLQYEDRKFCKSISGISRMLIMSNDFLGNKKLNAKEVLNE